ncbi:MAG: THUMP domain-containing protein [Bacteroidales bacterium]|nr:THUMP domain-containing protein [Bacteroidales bacterium]
MTGDEKFHAKTLKGLEPLLAEELSSLGASRTVIGNRGVTFFGGRALLYRANLASRLALRVLLPILHFEASDPDSLYRMVRRFDWSRYLDNRMTFFIDSVVHSPHFNNSQYVSQKVKDAIVDRFREATSLRPSVNKEQPDLLINVHISGNWVTISLDSSGGSLHRRGYRTGHGYFEAPLNEVLAAGMVMISGWKGLTPFLDPMCGSGTLAIEAALIAANIPPGIFRKHYGFENWKDFDRDLMEHVVRNLSDEREVTVPILARDADPEAVELTRRQVKQMDLQHIINVEQGDFSQRDGMEGATLIMNPPYGERLKPDDIESLYSMIGSTLKHKYPGSDAWILSSSKKALGRVGLKPAGKRVLFNGSLECSYVNYLTFPGNWKDHKAQSAGNQKK